MRHGNSGVITNIQQYSLHDGPGIRTTVFMKGCPLRCRWCCNPETQTPELELSYAVNKCIGKTACGWCENVCPSKAISFFNKNSSDSSNDESNKSKNIFDFLVDTASDEKATAIINRTCCTRCFRCVDICPSRALRREGREVTVAEVLATVEEQSVFYRYGGGGLTLSGGEPLHQPDFLFALLEEARRRNLNTAMETCGYAPYQVLERAAQSLDALFFDIKSIDDRKHRAFTGVSNSIILQNYTRLRREFPQLQITVRTPVVKGFNDKTSEQSSIRSYCLPHPHTTFEALTYHRFGEPKYQLLGRRYSVNNE